LSLPRLSKTITSSTSFCCEAASLKVLSVQKITFDFGKFNFIFWQSEFVSKTSPKQDKLITKNIFSSIEIEYQNKIICARLKILLYNCGYENEHVYSKF